MPGQHVGRVAPIQDVDIRITASKPVAPPVRPPFAIGAALRFEMIQGLARSIIAHQPGLGDGAQAQQEVVVPVRRPVKLERIVRRRFM